MRLRVLLADLSFLLGNKLVILSARLMGYRGVAEELKTAQAYWLLADAFKKEERK